MSKKRYYSKSTVRTMNLLELLARENGLTVTQIANSLNVSKSVAYTLLQTLISMGYVSQDRNHIYKLTYRMIALSTAITYDHFYESVRSLLRKISKATGQTCHYAIHDNNTALTILVAESSRTIKATVHMGQRHPLYCTAVGKIILSQMSDEEISLYLDTITFKRYTKNTVTSRKHILNEIGNIRKDSFALDREEHVKGGSCVAVKADLGNGHLGAISITGPTGEFSPKAIKMYLSVLRTALSNFHNLEG